MKKEDLKSGMLIQFRNNEIAMVIGDQLAQKHDWHHLAWWKNDLSFEDNEKHDIIKVSKILHQSNIKPINWTEATLNKYILWERQQPKEYTIQQIEELIGVSNIKIIK